MLEYISAPEAAKKWGISQRRVQKLCEENRIPGVAKFSLYMADTQRRGEAPQRAKKENKNTPL